MQHTSAAIPAGQSQSGTVELHNNAVTSLHMPAAWTGTVVTLLGAPTGKGPFQPVFDAAGVELAVTVAAGRAVVLDASATRGLRFLRLRAGTAAAPINQSTRRVVQLMLRDDA
jgi:hypothetical protein